MLKVLETLETFTINFLRLPFLFSHVLCLLKPTCNCFLMMWCIHFSFIQHFQESFFHVLMYLFIVYVSKTVSILFFFHQRSHTAVYLFSQQSRFTVLSSITLFFSRTSFSVVHLRICMFGCGLTLLRYCLVFYVYLLFF